MDNIKKLPNVSIEKCGKYAVRFEYVTAWTADYIWLDSFLDKYASCWIKNIWNAEDGKAGVWIGYFNDDKYIKVLEWEDLSLEDEHYYFIN